MCEPRVILNGKIVSKGVVYAKMHKGTVNVKDALGTSKEFKKCRITEIDVNSARMVLST